MIRLNKMINDLQAFLSNNVFNKPIQYLEKLNLGGAIDNKYRCVLNDGTQYLIRTVPVAYKNYIDFSAQLTNQVKAVTALNVMQRPLMVIEDDTKLGGHLNLQICIQEWVVGFDLYKFMKKEISFDVAKNIVRIWKTLTKISINDDEKRAAARKMQYKVNYLKTHLNLLKDDEQEIMTQILNVAEKNNVFSNIEYGFCHGDFFLANFIIVILPNQQLKLCPIDFTKCGTDFKYKDLCKILVFNIENDSLATALIKYIKNTLYKKNQWVTFLKQIILYALTSVSRTLEFYPNYVRSLIFSAFLTLKILKIL